jgi:hypothetical protein
MSAEKISRNLGRPGRFVHSLRSKVLLMMVQVRKTYIHTSASSSLTTSFDEDNPADSFYHQVFLLTKGKQVYHVFYLISFSIFHL